MSRARGSGTHLHGCPQCRDTFVCACVEAGQNPRCIPCIGNTGDSTLAHGRRPGACCVDGPARLARKDEIKTYKLAGSQPWWICPECKRAFSYQPEEMFRAPRPT